MRTGRWADGHDEAHSLFCGFVEVPEIPVVWDF